MNKTTVFIPHVPTRYDPLTDSRVPTLDLNPAATFGQLVRLTTPSAGPLTQDNLDVALNEIQHGISGIQPDDYVVAVGDPILVAAAIAYASDINGSVKVLRWDRHNHCYNCLEVPL